MLLGHFPTRLHLVLQTPAHLTWPASAPQLAALCLAPCHASTTAVSPSVASPSLVLSPPRRRHTTLAGATRPPLRSFSGVGLSYPGVWLRQLSPPGQDRHGTQRVCPGVAAAACTPCGRPLPRSLSASIGRRWDVLRGHENRLLHCRRQLCHRPLRPWSRCRPPRAAPCLPLHQRGHGHHDHLHSRPPLHTR